MTVAQRLALGRLVSISGGSATYIALVAAIYRRTHAAVWVSAAIFTSVVGSVASAPPGGWIGDRFDRRRVLIGADLASAAASLAMALTGQPLALVLLLALACVAGSPFEPASPRSVSPAWPSPALDGASATSHSALRQRSIWRPRRSPRAAAAHRYHRRQAARTAVAGRRRPRADARGLFLFPNKEVVHECPLTSPHPHRRG
jgi:hypothetical protein